MYWAKSNLVKVKLEAISCNAFQGTLGITYITAHMFMIDMMDHLVVRTRVHFSGLYYMIIVCI